MAFVSLLFATKVAASRKQITFTEMKIIHLRVSKWRNFRDLEIEIPEDASLVCLVGENGCGKSNLLELLATLSAQVGISPGIDFARGNPLSEEHDFEFTVGFRESLASLIEGTEYASNLEPDKGAWNGRITVTSKMDADGSPLTKLYAGGYEPGRGFTVATYIMHILRRRKSTHHLFLDADRSYPPVHVEGHEWANAVGRNWESIEWRRTRAIQPTSKLYKEWIEYFVSTETQHGTSHMARERAAHEIGGERPAFLDHFAPFKSSLRTVLPHLRFDGVDSQERTLTFDTSGIPLKFAQLSGGEREIAFLIGQIERFQLRQGLLLVDEPELHLNPDLIRTWVAFLRDTVTDGQVWIATHSLEAVEVAGRACSFVLRRNQGTRLVERVQSLESRPLLAELTATLGSPGFSISRRRFIFIEGERALNERERFHRLLGEPDVNRFMEAGGCKQVARRVEAVKQLASESDEIVRVGGILDRDFRPYEELERMAKQEGIIVLPCHEVENFFLHPVTLDSVASDHGITETAVSILTTAADAFAGAWIQQWACARVPYDGAEVGALKKAAWETQWSVIEADTKGYVAHLIGCVSGWPADQIALLENGLNQAIATYATERLSADLWKMCMGKQTLKRVAKRFGLAGADILETVVTQKWNRGTIAPPQELIDLRSAIAKL